mmetsp:Transcript_16574/g.26946  ORF Transcript_16574/g.26946 Transcript_16574/m.26946 type:complete len:264 (+) Transcript_16574:55-846(+)
MLSSAVHTLVAAIIWSSGDIFTANAGNFVSRRPACRSGLGDTATRLRTNAMMARVQRRVAPTNDDLHSERHQPHQTDMSKRRRKSLQSLLFGLPASAVLAFSTLNNAKPAFASTLTEDRGEEEASAGDESVADSFTVDQIIETIKDDIVEHQYLITGDLNDVIYTPECEFKQPLQTIKGTAEYKKRIGKLWDQSKSSVELLEVSRDDATHIVATWRITGALGGLYLFGSGKLAPFTGKTRYTLDPQSNKIVRSYEDWESTPWG